MKQFFSVQELLAINSPDLPKSVRGITMRAQKEGWRQLEGMAEKATGKTGGGGWLYHVSLFSDTTQTLLAMKYESDQSDEPKENELWARYNSQTAKQKKVCEERLTTLQTYLDYRKKKHTKTASIVLTSQHRGVGERTIHDWLRMVEGHKRSDWLAALVPNYTKTAKRTDCNPEAYELLKSDFLRPEKPSFSACYRRMFDFAKEKKLSPIPNERALRRHFNEDVPRSAQILARSGRDTAETLFPPQRRTRDHLHAMQGINIDGHKFDVFIRVPGRKKPTRVMLIAIQDLYSSKFVGWHIALSENKDAVRLAIGKMVEQYGIPEVAYLDNGQAFTSKAISGGVENRFRFKVKEDELKGLLVSLGTKINWTKPFHGQAKPIERAFGSLTDAIAKHPFCAGAYTGNKPDAQPENYGNRAIPLEDFRAFVDEQIRAHNAQPGRNGQGLNGRSFDQMFEESLAQDTTIVRWATEAQRALWLMAAERVRCRKGSGEVIIFKNRYWSVELNAWAGKDVTVRYDQQDLTKPVLIYDQDDRLICEAPLIADVKFDDVDAAREHGRNRNELMKAIRTQRDLHKKFTPNQLADHYMGNEKPAQTKNQQRPKVTRIATAKKVVNGPVEGWDEEMEAAFSSSLENIDTGNVIDLNSFGKEPDE